MRPLILAAFLAAAPVYADEVEDALEAALAAYRDGDVALAKEELDFAAAKMGELKAEGLAELLPAPFDGWTREDGETQAAGAAMFGGGLSASAVYSKGDVSLEMQIMADNPMVASMGAMLGNAQMMAAMGEVRRAGRQRYVVTEGAEIMALIANRVLVQIDGDADIEDKAAYFEALDFDALGAI